MIKTMEKTDIKSSVNEIRKDFPILNRKVNGRPLVYFDNAATSQKPSSVINEMRRYFEEYNANVHRVGHALGQEASLAYEQAREKIALFMNAKSSKEIIFTANATESVNLVAWTWGRDNIKENDEIIVSIMEHHSNFICWQQLAKEKKAILKIVDITDSYELDMQQFEQMLSDKTKLVAITSMSNVLGTINPVKKIAELTHKYGAKILVDASQSVVQMKTDVQDFDCDWLVFTGHKICGPTGIGVLYGKYDILKEMPPFMMGGGMITTVSIADSEWEMPPQRFEAGTPRISEAIGLGIAIDYINNLGVDNIRAYEEELTSYMIKQLLEIEGLTIYGPLDMEKRGATIAFSIKGIHPHDLGTLLDELGIAIRIGHHCAMPLHQRLAVDKTMRASLYFYNTFEEIDYFIQSLKKSVKIFQKFL